MMDKNRIMERLLTLCSIPSISESEGEILMAQGIYGMLSDMDYFRGRQDNVKLHKIEKDPLSRSYVTALMESTTGARETIILLSHFDVVGVEEFGAFRELAFDPIKYTEFLKDSDRIMLSKEVREELESGEYLFGRGTMDMKYGIAMDMELLDYAHINLTERTKNILMVSVPDEEANSAGMLAAVQELLRLKEQRGLEYLCCFVSEPHFPRFQGDNTKYIYTGTVGKIMPGFFCVGKETHAGEPFGGINPNLLTSAIIEEFEQNVIYGDSYGEDYAPAPVCLKQSDLKGEYSVQTPRAAYTYFNYITLKATPAEVMAKMERVAGIAFKRVLSDIKAKAELACEITGEKVKVFNAVPRIVTYSELYNSCVKVHGDSFETHMREYCLSSGIKDQRELSIAMIKEAHNYLPDRNPVVVLFFAPPYYPSSTIAQEDGLVTRVCKEIIEKAKLEYDEELVIDKFFRGISDMSYAGLPEELDIDVLKGNIPVFDRGYSIPLDTISKLNIPVLNIGPLGKDAHKYTERLNTAYSLDVAAELILAALLKFMEA